MEYGSPVRSSPFTFEVLYCAFVLFGTFAGIERAEVLPLAGLRIYFARIEPVLTGLQLSDHYDSPRAIGLFSIWVDVRAICFDKQVSSRKRDAN
jgi:hypothetical protein